MSIYAQRNRKGQLTGKFVVSIMRSGVIQKIALDTIDEATQVQAQWALGVNRKPVEANEPKQAYTVAQLAIDACRRLKGAKDETRAIGILERACEIIGPSMLANDVSYRDLENLVYTLQDNSKSTGTINRYLAQISGALKWARLAGHITSKCDVPWQTEAPGRIAFVKPENDARVLNYLKLKGKPELALIYEVLVTTGMRVGELLKLTKEDIRGQWLHLNDTKNGDSRDVPIQEALGRSLAALCVTGLPKYNYIHEWLVRASNELEISPVITPHVLRHTTATRLTSRGVPTAVIKDFLGHKTLSTTLKYAHVERATLQSAALLLITPQS